MQDQLKQLKPVGKSFSFTKPARVKHLFGEPSDMNVSFTECYVLLQLVILHDFGVDCRNIGILKWSNSLSTEAHKVKSLQTESFVRATYKCEHRIDSSWVDNVQ